jgi:hypothetical protein
MGSGEPLSRAAMILGASPVDSVFVACQRDLFCYGPPVSFIYDKATKKLLMQGDAVMKFHDDEFRV